MGQREGSKVVRTVIFLAICMCISLGSLALVKANPQASARAKQPHKVAIVIDDFGNGMKGTGDMLELGIPITVAVMPFLPTTKQDAEAAFAKGHEVIVHLPMEPVRGKRSWLGPGAITTDLTDDEVRARVEAAIADVPHARGINNHMGSKATSDPRVMKIIMQVCAERGLYFLDSRTTNKSKAAEAAGTLGVPVLMNDIFLDEVYTANHVNKQIKKLTTVVARKQETIAIGHVGPPGMITSSVLRSTIPSLKSTVQFVHLSELLPWKLPY